MKNHFRLRVGNYRVLIELHGGTPVVIEILHVLRRNNSTYLENWAIRLAFHLSL